MGAAVRRRAVRQRVAVAILDCVVGDFLLKFPMLKGRWKKAGQGTVGFTNSALDNCSCFLLLLFW
jgi:hypothetical protein